MASNHCFESKETQAHPSPPRLQNELRAVENMGPKSFPDVRCRALRLKCAKYFAVVCPLRSRESAMPQRILGCCEEMLSFSSPQIDSPLIETNSSPSVTGGGGSSFGEVNQAKSKVEMNDTLSGFVCCFIDKEKRGVCFGEIRISNESGRYP